MSWCRYHPQNAVYLGAQNEGRVSGPGGCYPCCGQPSFRYDPMPGPSGCQFREHSALVASDRERSILSITQIATEDHMLCENPSGWILEAVAANDQEPRWLGLCLTPSRGRPGLLPPLNPEESMSRIVRRTPGGKSFFAESSTDSDTIEFVNELQQRKYYAGDGNSSSSDGCESDCVTTSKFIHTKNTKKRARRPADIPGRHWSGELSARSNQDYQREFEEKVMKQVVALINQKNGFEQNVNTQAPSSLGGSFLRLEADWREQLKQKHTNFLNTTGVNSNCMSFSNNNNNNIMNIGYDNAAKKRMSSLSSSNF